MYPEEEYEKKEAEKLNAESWMLELLKQNPEYVFWGNFEDYMIKDGSGWDHRLQFDSWKSFGPWELGDYNEVVNFYFEVNRDSKECELCEHTGYNEGTLYVYNTFYDHMNVDGIRWCNNITQDEFEALKEHGRIRKFNSVDEVNHANTRGSYDLLHSHDAINMYILVETRAKRLGVYGTCEECDGRGYIFTEEHGHLDLQLWVLHPRKGCSRGVYIKNIQQEEIKEVIAFLKGAALRNAKRFSLLRD